jgi:hypothetical protein
MFDRLTTTRTELEALARGFEPHTLTGEEAVRVVKELGVIRRLIDGMLGKAAWRVEDTSAHRRNGENDRDAAQLVGRAVGADASGADHATRHAFVTAVIKKGRDIACVAHFGRHIPAHLRTAMIVGGRECVVAGCSARGYLEIDHSDVDYAKGGPAAWWNLDYGCSPHHRLKTQGWKLGPRDNKTGKRTLTAPVRPSAVARR